MVSDEADSDELDSDESDSDESNSDESIHMNRFQMNRIHDLFRVACWGNVKVVTLTPLYENSRLSRNIFMTKL